jgi:hypothetical protein
MPCRFRPKVGHNPPYNKRTSRDLRDICTAGRSGEGGDLRRSLSVTLKPRWPSSPIHDRTPMQPERVHAKTAMPGLDNPLPELTQVGTDRWTVPLS